MESVSINDALLMRAGLYVSTQSCFFIFKTNAKILKTDGYKMILMTMEDRSIGGIYVYGIGFDSPNMSPKDTIKNDKFSISVWEDTNTINMCKSSTEESFSLNCDSGKYCMCLKYNLEGARYIVNLDDNEKLTRMLMEYKDVMSKWCTGKLNVEIIEETYPEEDGEEIEFKLIINTSKTSSVIYPLIEHLAKLESCQFFYDTKSIDLAAFLKYKLKNDRIWPLDNQTSG
jgi:hypothetical protein